jgi:hypothetical protein
MFFEKGFPHERKENNWKETKMARVYLSFLGTNDYLLCIYYFQEKEIQGIRFVQEATISMNCRDWSSVKESC